MLGRLRATVKPLIRRLAAPLARRGVSPHAVTLTALPLALAAAISLRHHHLWVGVVLAVLAALVDLVDGAVAALQARTSPLGNYMETMVDKVVDVILYVGVLPCAPTAACLACATGLLVSYAKARVGLVIVTDNRDWPALGDRADRLVLFIGGLTLAALRGPDGATSIVASTLWTVTSVNLLGIVQRTVYAAMLIRRAQRTGTLLPYMADPTSLRSPSPPADDSPADTTP